MQAKASWHLVAKVIPSPKSLWTASVQPPVNVAAASGWSLFLELEWTGAWNEDMNLSNTSSLKMRIISSAFFCPCSQRFHGRTGRAIRERWKEVYLEVPLAARKPAAQKRNDQSRWVKYLSSDGKESRFSVRSWEHQASHLCGALINGALFPLSLCAFLWIKNAVLAPGYKSIALFLFLHSHVYGVQRSEATCVGAWDLGVCACWRLRLMSGMILGLSFTLLIKPGSPNQTLSSLMWPA